MFPDANAPSETQPWVRDVTTRSDAARRKASVTEGNAYNLAANAKTSYELIDDRIANIGSFTTGLFEQGQYSSTANSYAALSSIPILYEYADGSYQEYAVVQQRIPFARYNELTVTTDGEVHSYSTTVGTTISTDRPLRPMIAATLPPLPRISGTGVYTDNASTYAARYTVENFEPFLDYAIPGNLVPSGYSAWYGQDSAAYHPNAPGQVQSYRDGYNGYSMKYTRQWLMDYMDAVRDYTNENFPPASGEYLSPDVNRVEIVLGWYYRAYTSGVATNNLAINDNRLTFSATGTFVLEGVKNLGY